MRTLIVRNFTAWSLLLPHYRTTRSRVMLMLFSLTLIAAFKGENINAQAGSAQAGNTNLGAKARAAIPRLFGPGVEVSAERKPYFLSGDFNGDAFPDLLVVVHVKVSAGKLPKEITMLNPWGYEQKGSPGASNLALAIVHGSSEGWDVQSPAGRYLLRDRAFFSTPIWEDATQEGLISVVRKKPAKGRKGAASPATAKGDLINVATESGADLRLYWDGKTYRIYTPKED